MKAIPGLGRKPAVGTARENERQCNALAQSGVNCSTREYVTVRENRPSRPLIVVREIHQQRHPFLFCFVAFVLPKQLLSAATRCRVDYNRINGVVDMWVGISGL